MTQVKKKRVVVGMSTCNMAAGSDEVLDFLKEKVAGGLDVELSITGCTGMCYSEPQVQVFDEDGTRHLYVGVNANRIAKIVEDHLIAGKPRDKWIVKEDEGDTQKLMASPFHFGPRPRAM